MGLFGWHLACESPSATVHRMISVRAGENGNASAVRAVSIAVASRIGNLLSLSASAAIGLTLLFTPFADAEPLTEQSILELIRAVGSADLGVAKPMIEKMEPETINYGFGSANETLLHIAVSGGRRRSSGVVAGTPDARMELLELLISKGADPKTTDDYGRTPLHANNLAPEHFTAALDLLIQHGADINAQDRSGNTYLIKRAERAQDPDDVKNFAQRKGKLNLRNNKGDTALHRALTRKNRLHYVRTLVDNGAAIDIANNNGFTPMHLAATLGDIRVTEFLLERGAGLNVATPSGLTPIAVAAKSNRWKVVERLLQLGADPNVPYTTAQTLALYLVQNEEIGLSELVKQQGFQPDAPVAGAKWPLLSAISSGDADGVAKLIEAGSNVNSRNGTNDAALPYLAQQYPSRRLSQQAAEKIFKLLLTSGADVNATDADGRTALHYAVRHKELELASWLVDAGANLNTADTQGSTALDLCLLKRALECTDFLLDRGANRFNPRNAFEPLRSAFGFYDRDQDQASKARKRRLLKAVVESGLTFDLDQPGQRNAYESLSRVKVREVKDLVSLIKVKYKPDGAYVLSRLPAAYTRNPPARPEIAEPGFPPDFPDYLKESIRQLPPDQRRKLLAQLALDHDSGNAASNCQFPTLPEEFDVFAVGTYKGLNRLKVEGYKNGNKLTEGPVIVNRPGKNTLLVLMSYDPVVWKIRRTSGTNIIGVLIGGYHEQTVLGLVNTIPVLYGVHEGVQDCDYFYAYEAGAQLDRALRVIKQATSKEPLKLITRPDDGNFLVGTKAGLDKTRLLFVESAESRRLSEASIPKGVAGLVQLQKEGKIRLATRQDIDAWVEAASEKYRKLGDELRVGHHMRVGNTYVILSDVYLPDGLYGAHSVSFLLPRGMTQPRGPAGHNTFYFMDGGGCSLGFRAPCPR